VNIDLSQEVKREIHPVVIAHQLYTAQTLAEITAERKSCM